jgi:uncharacterized protein (DUF362 family)
MKQAFYLLLYNDPTGGEAMRRRDFLKQSGIGATLMMLGTAPSVRAGARTTKVALVRTDDRAKGIAAALKLISFPSPKGKRILIKPNFTSADAAPASTHNDAIRQLVLEMRSRGASQITVGDSCGRGETKTVLESKNIPELSRELGFELINFDELPAGGWVHFDPPASHWANGFDVARPVAESEYLVWTCCLKTHQFGGIHSMSIKLGVGVINRKMRSEMHAAINTHMRKMIAEIHGGFTPQLILMDGMDIFTDGGPTEGKRVRAGLIIVGTDRIAVDAVGLAVLKHHGTTNAIMSKKIFEQEQMARAVEMGIGIKSPDQIEIMTGDPESLEYAGSIKEILAVG